MSRRRAAFDFRGVVRITKLGLGFLGFTFVIGFAALNTGNNSLYVILAFMLGTLVASGVASKRGISGVEAELRDPGELWANRPVRRVLTVANRSRWLTVRDLVVVMPEMSGPVLIPRIERKATVEIPVELVFARRGRVSLRHVDAYTRYPLGLFTKKRRVKIEADAVVFPEIRKQDLGRGRQLEGGDLRAMNRPGHGLETFGFREYQSGESVRAIHWKRSVSTGRWIVRQGTVESSDEVVVVLDTHVPAGTDEAEFEALVSGAATAVLDAHRAGSRVTLHLPGAVIGSDRGVTRIFEALALVEGSPEGGSPAVPPGAIVFSLRWGEGDRRETA